MNVRLYQRKNIWWASWTSKRITVRRSTRARSESEARVVVDSWGVLPSARTFKFDVWGLVYFVEAVGTDRVKIGWTKDDGLEQRLATLQTGCPYPLRAVATYPGLMFHEHQEHSAFRDDWVHGEWFVRSPNLERRMRSIREPSVHQTDRDQK